MAKVTKRGPSEGYMGKWNQRHAQAEAVDQEIRSMAFPTVGEHPGAIETFAGEDPASIGFSVGGMMHQPHMLTHDQTLQKWEVPNLPPSHGEGFGSSVATNIAEGTIPNTPHISRELGKLSERMAPGGHSDPLGQIVSNRRAAIRESLESGDPDAAWYQGKAQALIHHAAGEHDVPVSLMRKTTAAESPRSKWDHTYGNSAANRRAGIAKTTIYPNLTDAGHIVEAAKGRSPDEAAEEVVSRGIAGVGRQNAARVAASMLQGTMRGDTPIPKAGESEKIDTFDVNLADPNHPQYGYSPYVHRHQLSGHTSDVMDAKAAGIHEDQLEVPRPPRMDKETGERVLDAKGKPAFVGKPHHEEVLQHPAGADIFHGTALVARTEEFQAQRAEHGEEWAKQNAMNFMPGPSQSMQWSVSRTAGKADAPGNVGIPEHVQAAYDARPKPTGFGGYHGPGTRMTKRDWGQV